MFALRVRTRLMLLLGLSSLTAVAGSCIVAGSTDRPAPAGSFAANAAMDLETRIGMCARGSAEQLCPFEARIGNRDRGVPMSLTTRPRGLYLIVR